ncbi:class II aldolase/adducin family protein [Pseudomonas sp. HR96]|uniref:class II aldolase/adducin family protein n=1 Tax=Pseudomonas sp. HR96 TaxID=1027966 RepID=UPI002A7604F7|nr:class II aldolase/adducin family protein [Pseudomonas sp. HR96]WPO97938.1 class II aldolase/adducin family protein [Pseudomonas sp. HR96]
MNLHDIPAAEWQARCDLAALYRLLAHFRMTDLIDTHISLRLDDGSFLINRYGVLFEHMKATDLVRIDGEGQVVDRFFPQHRVNRAGFVIHSAIHAARADLHCVIHTHTAAGIAVAAQAKGLLPISQHALKFYNRLGYHRYQGIALDTAERDQLVRDLGPHSAMILCNHGLLAAGGSVAEAFQTIFILERACQAQVQALAGGSELLIPDPAVCEFTARQFEDDDGDGLIQLGWDAALTLIAGQRDAYCA